MKADKHLTSRNQSVLFAVESTPSYRINFSQMYQSLCFFGVITSEVGYGSVVLAFVLSFLFDFFFVCVLLCSWIRPKETISLCSLHRSKMTY